MSTDQKNPVGRPPVDDPHRPRPLKCRDAQWEAYREAAESKGVSLSEWIRAVLDRAAARVLRN